MLEWDHIVEDVWSVCLSSLELIRDIVAFQSIGKARVNLELLKIALYPLKIEIVIESVDFVIVQIAFVDSKRVSEPWAGIDKRLLNFIMS